MSKVLILYYSDGGATMALADEILQGVEAVAGVEAVLRTVPTIVDGACVDSKSVPEQGALYVQPEDIRDCAALALGSPVHFGQLAAPLQHFFAKHIGLWLSGALIDKPATVFASGGSMHGGQEAILLNMMIPLLHHGAVLCGIPYSEGDLHATRSGGTPYGVTHVGDSATLSEEERRLARAQGKRLAQWALKAQHKD
ncbi:NAD(P)H:quinone oxidoreductase [Suttonella sp. R2A3]|uniref:NAD(P)H:quinone oxidoreductase n=1 Tax=Suttonella sp. R2A3 TaxID=2908648 RepID=UPI001F330ED8|nr:NAD(P)H:quinone oxidoreductase [Suttonella sp. R2A3]UJF24762.1 NAD(P)H:quinone oxidoreductase [Suttonella sp. R2A3]